MNIIKFISLAFLLWSLALSPAKSAVAVDVKGTVAVATAATAASCNNCITVGTSLSNGALVVGMVLTYANALPAPASISVTWNGIAMTQCALSTGVVSNSTDKYALYIYELAAPASGQQNLAITWTNVAIDVYFASVSFTGVDQTTGCNNQATATATSASAAVTVTSATGNFAVSVFGLSGGQHFSSTADTDWFHSSGAANENSTAAYGAGSASKTLTVTLDNSNIWAGLGANIVAAGGGGGSFVAYPSVFGIGP